MKKEDIKISGLYAMKVGRNTIGVRIMSQNSDGHWVGRNLKTDKDVLIKSADRLCGVYDPKADDKLHTSDHVEKKSAGTAKDAMAARDIRQGGLAGAAKVLKEAGEPLGCHDIVKRMLEKGYWKTDGKTPQATIYSAIIREIREKGADARFRKTERGKFELAK